MYMRDGTTLGAVRNMPSVTPVNCTVSCDVKCFAVNSVYGYGTLVKNPNSARIGSACAASGQNPGFIICKFDVRVILGVNVRKACDPRIKLTCNLISPRNLASASGRPENADRLQSAYLAKAFWPEQFLSNA